MHKFTCECASDYLGMQARDCVSVQVSAGGCECATHDCECSSECMSMCECTSIRMCEYVSEHMSNCKDGALLYSPEPDTVLWDRTTLIPSLTIFETSPMFSFL